MRDGKPKMTEEEVDLMYNTAKKYERDEFKKILIDAGYMEKPKTALERAERLFSEWGKEPSQDEDEEQKIIDIVDAFRYAIAELTDTINKYKEERHEA